MSSHIVTLSHPHTVTQVDRYAGEEVFNVPEPASVTYM
jgi:hypothetical protein